MKTLEQINLEIAEMWDAILQIPLNDPGRDAAFEEAHQAEASIRWEYELRMKEKEAENKVNDTAFLCQLHGVMSLFYAEHNIDKQTFIDKCFVGESDAIRYHLRKKFENRNFSIFDLITDLDAIFRVTLVKYLVEKYKGFPFEDAENYLQYYKINQKKA